MIRNIRRPLPPPVENMDALWSLEERAAVNQMLYYSFIGSPEMLEAGLSSFISKTGVQELMVTTHMFDVNAKLRSLELTASLFKTNKISTFA
jgi:hypothetical protein